MRLQGNVLTEKGNLKPAARKAILDAVVSNPALLGTAEKVNEKVYTIKCEDAEGHVFFLNLDLSVSATHPADRKEKKATPKAPKPAEVFTIIE